MANYVHKIDIDCRYITEKNVRDNNIQEWLKERYEDWIMKGEMLMQDSAMHDIWRTNAYYYEGFQVPIGFTNSPILEFINKNEANDDGTVVDGQVIPAVVDTRRFRVKKNKFGKLFYVENKITEIIDGHISEYTSGEKVIQVKNDDDPTNDRMETATQHWLTAMQKRLQFWSDYFIPMAEKKEKYGLSWLNTWYDPYVNIAKYGEIGMEVINPWDMLIWAEAGDKYFLNTTPFIIHKKHLPIEEARELLEQFDIKPEDVIADQDYYYRGRTVNRENKIIQEEYVTLYYIEYRKKYVDAVPLSEFEITEGGKDMLKEQRTYYFESLYNRSLGTVYHKINQYADPRMYNKWQFKRTPCCDKPSELRAFPISKVEKLINVQDIINVLSSLIINNARFSDMVRGFVLKQLKDDYPAEFKDWVETGGLMPIDNIEDINKAVKFFDWPGTSPEIAGFLDIAKTTMKNQGIRHEVLTGELPEGPMGGKREVSGKAIQRLQAANAVRLTPDATNVEWTVTQVTNLLYKMAAVEFTHEAWAAIENARKGDPQYIPINATMSIKEYDAMLFKMYPDLDPLSANKRFQEHNMVKVDYALKDQETGRILEEEEVMGQYSEVRVNHLKDRSGEIFLFNITVTIDFDFEKNKMEEKQIIAQLFAAGKFPLDMFLETQGGTLQAQKDEIVRKLREEQNSKYALALAAEVEKRGPEFAQLVMTMAAEHDKSQQMKEKQTKGAEAA